MSDLIECPVYLTESYVEPCTCGQHKPAWYDLIPANPIERRSAQVSVPHHTRLDAHMSIEWIETLGQGWPVSGDELARIRKRVWA